jgi:hypothetical protein
VRDFIAPLIIAGFLGFSAAASIPALAADVHLPQQTVDEMKGVCTKAGGKFSQDANSYECGTDCHGGPGTDCVVFCKAGEKCIAQVIGARRPKNALSALQAPTHSR